MPSLLSSHCRIPKDSAGSLLLENFSKSFVKICQRPWTSKEIIGTAQLAHFTKPKRDWKSCISSSLRKNPPKITTMFATSLLFQGFEYKSILSLEIAMQICLLPSLENIFQLPTCPSVQSLVEALLSWSWDCKCCVRENYA